MSAMREELHHLVDELPEAEVRPVLELIRSRADAAHGVRELPFFASFGPKSAADMLLCDTGVLLAAGNVRDHHHAACLELMRTVEGPLLVPSPVLGEIGYLLQSRIGPHAEVTFLKSFGGNGFHVAEVEEGDISRIAELVEQYVSLPLGIVDAAVIAIAERLSLTEVATVDRKHFSIVRPRHVSAFRLLPEAL
jgi:predicted nucleic acid-binding protein